MSQIIVHFQQATFQVLRAHHFSKRPLGSTQLASLFEKLCPSNTWDIADVSCSKFECWKDIHFKTQPEPITNCEKCNFQASSWKLNGNCDT